MVTGIAKNYLSQVNDIWLLIMLSGLNLLVMHYYVFFSIYQETGVDITVIIDNLIGVLIDLSLLLIIISIMTWRKRKISLFLVFVITLLWSFSNVMYSRFFHHYLSLSAIEQIGILKNELIISSIENNFKWIDLYYVFSTITFCYFFNRTHYSIKITSVTKRMLLITLLILLMSPCIHAAYCLCNNNLRYTTYYLHRLYSFHITTNRTVSQPNFTNFERGNIRNLCIEMYLDLQGTLELSKEQREVIFKEISESKSTLNDSKKVDIDKNVIFILVESYMSFTSDMIVEGKEVTPNLNALKRDSTVYYNGKMHENVTNGESSDGQFIYMTGLLPLRSIVTVSQAKKRPQPALPKYLHRKSQMIIPTPADVWNQPEMCQQYGFDSLIASDAYIGGVPSGLSDEQVFQLAEKNEALTDKPFFSVILTLSMHQPYKEQIDSSFIIKSPAISDELACYLNVCHYTDHQIGKYIEHLKQEGVFDNSLIIIAADHPVHTTDFDGRSKDIPLYIVNIPSRIQKTMWKGECNQIDVFTTLLDLLNVESDWYGLGHSLLSPNYSNAISNQKWDVSEWIIRGNYFHNL